MSGALASKGAMVKLIGRRAVAQWGALNLLGSINIPKSMCIQASKYIGAHNAFRSTDQNITRGMLITQENADRPPWIEFMLARGFVQAKMNSFAKSSHLQAKRQKSKEEEKTNANTKTREKKKSEKRTSPKDPERKKIDKEEKQKTAN